MKQTLNPKPLFIVLDPLLFFYTLSDLSFPRILIIFFFVGIIKTKGLCHTVALPFTCKSILRPKKNYGNSNISPCKNTPYLLKKSSKRNQNPSRYYNNSVTNLKFQNTSQNIMFQKSSYENRPIIYYLGGQKK
jgi:hypothetical protein